MVPYRQIRARYDAQRIVVYQAFNPPIADAAVEAQRFVPPFSVGRMTWVKPSFLWMMERCGWATKPNQERVLAVHLRRDRWEAALAMAAPSAFLAGVDADVDAWRARLATSPVRYQWDPERSLRGGELEHRSLQLRLWRAVAADYARGWIDHIEDITPLVMKLSELRRRGEHRRAAELLPEERPYPLEPALGMRLGIPAAECVAAAPRSAGLRRA
jgi:hypothetical protein